MMSSTSRGSSSTTATKLRRQVVVVVVRHGERLDYQLKKTKGINWIQQTTTSTSKQQQPRPWDPPLTNHGIRQAKALGTAIGDILKSYNLPCKISSIYTSPFYRCRQTSVALAMSHYQYQQNQQNQEQEQKHTQLTNDGITNGDGTPLKVQVYVEYGLSESFNENFYRSWSLPDSDSTWGYKRKELPLHAIDTSTLHPISKQPVQKLLQVTMEYNGDDDNNDDNNDDSISLDMNDWIDTTSYKSKTSITAPYSFHPPNFESFKMQRQRMEDTLNELSQTHYNNNETFVMVSHGTYSMYLLYAVSFKVSSNKTFLLLYYKSFSLFD